MSDHNASLLNKSFYVRNVVWVSQHVQNMTSYYSVFIDDNSLTFSAWILQMPVA